MKKINWRIVNIAFWTEVLLSYVLPFRVIDNFEYKVGFPIPFLSVYDSVIGINPLISMRLNPLGFLLNGAIIYLIIVFAAKAYHRIKNNTAERAQPR